MNRSLLRFVWRVFLVTGMIAGVFFLNGAALWVKAAPNAVLVVNNIADVDDVSPGDGVCETASGNNVCTLRAAIREANALAGAETITLPAGTYVLSLVGDDDTAAAGDLDISGDLTITGAGLLSTVIDANSAATSDRALDILYGVVSISGVSVQNGYAPQGGGIQNYGTLTIANSYFTANEAASAVSAFVKGGAIFSGGPLTVSSTTFSLNKADAVDNNAYGGAVYVEFQQPSSFTNVTFSDNHAKGGASAYGAGGAFYNFGTATLANCNFSNNSVQHHTSSSFQAVGGAIHNNRYMTIQDSTLENNISQGYGGNIYNSKQLETHLTTLRYGSAFEGGGLYMPSVGEAYIERTAVYSNTASQSGGGIYTSGKLLLENSTLIDNLADSTGGGLMNNGELTIFLSTISQNAAASILAPEYGGGIYNFGSKPVYIIQTTIDNNQAALGGGIYNGSTLTMTISASTIRDNVGSSIAAGIYNLGPLLVRDSTFSSNKAGADGGAIYNQSVVYAANSTFSGNEAKRNGGAIDNTIGAAVYLSNVTITLNKADTDTAVDPAGDGGGIYNFNGGSITLRNSLIAGNDDMTSEATPADDCSGTLISDGYNLLGKNTDCSGLVNGVDGDLVGTGAVPINPMLGPLANNGGPTRTHLPQIGSPAIDAGNPAGCIDALNFLLALDQRGYVRPVDGNANAVAICDIGATEFLSVLAKFLYLPVLLH